MINLQITSKVTGLYMCKLCDVNFPTDLTGSPLWRLTAEI